MFAMVLNRKTNSPKRPPANWLPPSCTYSTQPEVRLVLTGGGAGIATLRHLASYDHLAARSADDFPMERIDWHRVLIFFGDERFLPVGDPERNDTQADEALLQHVSVPAENIFRYGAPEDSSLDDAATAYAQTVREQA